MREAPLLVSRSREFEVVHLLELRSENTREFSVHSRCILQDALKEFFTLLPARLERPSLLSDLIVEHAECIDDILHLISKL